MSEFLKIFGVAGAVVAGVTFLIMVLEGETCLASWRDSSFPVRWGIWKGCQIQLADGSWLPSDNYREIP